MSKTEFDDFSKSLKDVLEAEGIPSDRVFVHGSRANGSAKSGISDIDVKVILDDKDFGKLAAKRISETSGRTKSNIMKTVRNQQRINARGISKTFESSVWDNVYSKLPKGEFSKVQVSVMTSGSPFNTGPHIALP
ncbi:nucleotidyltransferase domain-containing protein [Pectobacterium carotovorum]|uniref:nucleotidyltransferase domain-containing protein n=1 Tax=Pectobacterium carotovorum TaxID=554 RepID=UPI001CC1D2B8|nr:nucleotidyltransferase domain-containing protein [Pectobacterium carotovorum]UCZ81738.1 nucleotidyltransferase domain-containing protein [Pectobacterium carotovorum]